MSLRESKLESEVAACSQVIGKLTEDIRSISTAKTDLKATVARLEAELAGAEAVIHSIDCEVDGYVDGAPDCNAVSKLANAVHNIIHTEGTRESDAASLREEKRALRHLLNSFLANRRQLNGEAAFLATPEFEAEVRKALAPAAPANGGAKL